MLGESGQAELLAAIGQYEAGMRHYAFEAVRVSLQTGHKTVRSNYLHLVCAAQIERGASGSGPLDHHTYTIPPRAHSRAEYLRTAELFWISTVRAMVRRPAHRR